MHASGQHIFPEFDSIPLLPDNWNKAKQSRPEIKFVCKGENNLSDEDLGIVAKGAILHKGNKPNQQ